MVENEYTQSLEKRVNELEELVSSFKKRMYIPTVGSVISLTKEWTFSLHCEYRNLKLWESLKLPDDGVSYWKKQTVEIVKFPKGTVLKVKRIYVRQGKADYDSVTFTVVKHPNKIKGSFWSKLNDVNNIEFELIDGRGKTGE